MQKFTLKPGESKSIKNAGTTFTLSCDLFKDHDHKTKPLYYYHDGLNDKDFVATVEGTDSPLYDSPCVTTVKGNATIARKNILISFTKKKGRLEVEIEPNSLKSSQSAEKIYKGVYHQDQ